MGEIQDKILSSLVIGAAIKVHKELGPGYLESFYEEALCIEMARQKLSFERQKSITVRYQDLPIGEHRLDLFVDGRLVVELKAISELDPIHFTIVRSYMKATNVESGLLINFGTMPVTVKRGGREKLVSS